MKKKLNNPNNRRIMKYRMLYKTRLPFLLFCGLLAAAGLSSCDRTRNDKGYEYFPDMAHSLAYETYSPNPVYKDSATMQAPVKGTVNRDFLPFHYPANDSGRVLAGKELVCPLEYTEKNLALGKERFQIFCMNCHGEKGLGDGYLFTSKRYTLKPASLVSEKMMKAPIGEIYHVITKGWGVMGAHGSQIKPDDRWRIAMYIQREFQKKTN